MKKINIGKSWYHTHNKYHILKHRETTSEDCELRQESSVGYKCCIPQAISEPNTMTEVSYLDYGELLYSHPLDTGSGPKSSFQIKVNFAFHLEFKVPESLGKMERHRIPR